jgi:hypothetical protein
MKASLAGLLLALTVMIAGLSARPDGQVHITVLDVGQGDAILVEGDRGGRLLIDGGPDPDRLIVELDARIPPWDRRIDVLILSTPTRTMPAACPGWCRAIGSAGSSNRAWSDPAPHTTPFEPTSRSRLGHRSCSRQATDSSSTRSA